MPEPFPAVARIETPTGALFVESEGAEDLVGRYDRLHQGSPNTAASIDFLRVIGQELR
ncbi:hypothetical protein [Nocardiopsis halotolerans]|uniref:hypothetical protein n=1 Tax=Nocardiopsis halotolerans TaxID=124252 RepID=UPI0003464741|nr:hypothetical protein [Nocardiopsis halotolerans]